MSAIEGIDDGDLETELLACAGQISGLSEDEVMALLANGEDYRLLDLMRATGRKTGRKLFVALARKSQLTVEEDDWDGLPAAAKLFFDLLARLVWAFADAPIADVPEPVVKTVQAKPPKVTDTIFERYGDRPNMEKTGGLDLSPGQPVSTAQIHIERIDDPLTAKMRALGMAPPIGSDGEDAARFAAEIRARMPPAPPMTPPLPMTVSAYIDGQPVAGTVFISRPAQASGGVLPSLPSPEPEPAAEGSFSQTAPSSPPAARKGKRK